MYDMVILVVDKVGMALAETVLPKLGNSPQNLNLWACHIYLVTVVGVGQAKVRLASLVPIPSGIKYLKGDFDIHAVLFLPCFDYGATIPSSIVITTVEGVSLLQQHPPLEVLGHSAQGSYLY